MSQTVREIAESAAHWIASHYREGIEYQIGEGNMPYAEAVIREELEKRFAAHVLAFPTEPLGDERYMFPDGSLKWSSPVDVGHLIAQLQTLDPAMRVSSVAFVEIDGKRKSRAYGLSMSRERWDENGWLDYRREGPECLAIWASTEHTADLERLQAELKARSAALEKSERERAICYGNEGALIAEKADLHAQLQAAGKHYQGLCDSLEIVGGERDTLQREKEAAQQERDRLSLEWDSIRDSHVEHIWRLSDEKKALQKCVDDYEAELERHSTDRANQRKEVRTREGRSRNWSHARHSGVNVSKIVSREPMSSNL